MKTLCIRCILWVFSVLFIQRAAMAQDVPTPQTTTSSTASPLITLETGKQKKPKVKKQWKFAVDIDAGFANPGADLAEAFKGGLNVSIGVKTAFLNDKLWVRPVGGLKYYWKNGNLGETKREAFRTYKAGLELQYKAYTVNKFTFFPILRADNNWSVNQVTKKSDEKTSTAPFTSNGKLLTGTGYSFDAGIMVVRSGDLYVKLDYEYYKPELTVTPELAQEMLTTGMLIQEKKVYNCSSINLSVGVNLNFKK
ncbi:MULTISPECIES: hypothetical protein [Niastella]|uniref:Outer membrane protein beta-barrel domain-containing protein n=1 Tax=Niastella soli TaxID=2821487 RepID=A0ABS3Z1R9_9BACT|nr:hypothetical protein [Niastella soli]MBO9204092.1 hypothetical protein [Niastella soli]